MISVIICSTNPDLLQQVSESIKQTIGTSYEILVRDNRKKNEGICEVYNQLALQAIYPYLCFVHEDVIFETTDWGNRALSVFKDFPATGLLGIAGCKYKSSFYSGWFSGIKAIDCANYIHQYPTKEEKVCLSPEPGISIQETVCIDGVFMFVSRNIWSAIKFNENALKGFHFYDIDFSLRAAKKCKVFVTYNILLRHITFGGDYSDNWMQTAIDYHKTVNHELPFSTININQRKADLQIIRNTLDSLKNYKIRIENKFNWVISQKLYLYPSVYYSVLKFFLYQPLGLKRIHQLLKSK
ncbi:hypothetical protein BH20BAC1_BH20BAC1_19600 [soil metagenome]